MHKIHINKIIGQSIIVNQSIIRLVSKIRYTSIMIDYYGIFQKPRSVLFWYDWGKGLTKYVWKTIDALQPLSRYDEM